MPSQGSDLEQDQNTYRRAASAALIGLLTQVLLFIIVAFVAVYAQAPSMNIATWHLAGGIPIWIILWVLLNQHRLERVEALEEEQLAQSSVRAAAMFEGGEELRDTQHRLRNLYKWGLPLVSIGLVIYLLVVGGLFLYKHYGIFSIEGYESTVMRPEVAYGFLSFFFVGATLISFLVARYVAGMTQVDAYQPLRGGAGYMMGSMFVLGLLAVGAITQQFGNAVVLAVLQIALPVIMLLLGIEFLLNLLLGLYRPRRGREFVRPAFDSRLLGWLTRPESIGAVIGETINYQFGFEISRSWFYQLLSRAFMPLVFAGLLVLILLSSIVVVAPQQQAVITTFGKFDHVVEPGLSFKLPWPVGRAQKFDAYRVHQVVIGSRIQGEEELDDKAILWTNEHTEGQEEFMVTASSAANDEAEGSDIAAGELIGADIVIKYRISDLERYVKASDEPKELLIALAEREVNRYFATKLVDELLGKMRATAGEQLHVAIQDVVNKQNLGIEVVFVSVSGVHPPQDNEVAAAFHEVIDAVQEKQVTIETARKEAVEVLAKVAGTVKRAEELSESIGKLQQMRNELRNMSEEQVAERMVLQKQIDELNLQIERKITLEDQVGSLSAQREAGGEAAQRVLEAKAYRWSRPITELAEAERFASEVYAYENAPEYYKARLSLDVLADALAQRRKIILDTALDPTIRLELENEKSLEGILGTRD